MSDPRGDEPAAGAATAAPTKAGSSAQATSAAPKPPERESEPDPDHEKTMTMRLPVLPPPAAVPPSPPARRRSQQAPTPTAATPTPTPGPTPDEPRQVVRATGPPKRPPLIVQGLWPAAFAGSLVLAAAFGIVPLTVLVVGLQLFLILGALALLDAPASGGAFLLATLAALGADAVVLVEDGRTTGLAGVLGLTLVGALLHQLARRNRSRVTESLADTLVVAVSAVAASCLLAVPQLDGGDTLLLVCLSAAGAVLLAGRIGDRIVARPLLALGATRGWPGFLLGLGAGVATAVLVADLARGSTGTLELAMVLDLPLRSAALLGLVIGATVATADLMVDLGAAELRRGWRDARRVAALRPTALLLPYALLGPVALLAGRLVLP